MLPFLYETGRTLAEKYLLEFSYPWEALQGLKKFLAEIGGTLGPGYRETAPMVWIHEEAEISGEAFCGAPCVICSGARLRRGAYLRGGVLIGRGCTVGNAELKNAILFDEACVPHFNYVGDSVLGYRAHMGAGAVASNLKEDGSPVIIGGVGTGLRKCGSFLGDFVEIGCNCVLNPGTVVGRNTRVYPLLALRGVYPEDVVVKTTEQIVEKHS